MNHVFNILFHFSKNKSSKLCSIILMISHHSAYEKNCCSGFVPDRESILYIFMKSGHTFLQMA